MGEDKRKHLEFLQNVIARMNTNSFMIKGWAITLVSALFALAARDANPKYVLITYVVLPVFWIIDGFFLATERQYRALYNEVRSRPETNIDFSMDASQYATGDNTWVSGIASKTLFPFYGVALLVTACVMFLISR